MVKVPDPVVVHAIELKLLTLAGVVWVLKLNVTFRHTASSLPAFTTGLGVIVNCIVLAFGAQVPLPVAVNVKVTTPVSPAVGVYVGLNVFAFTNVPNPPVQVNVLNPLAVATVVLVPKLMLVPWHVSALLPAFTTTCGVTVNTI